jgi:hypothetical protein
MRGHRAPAAPTPSAPPDLGEDDFEAPPDEGARTTKAGAYYARGRLGLSPGGPPAEPDLGEDDFEAPTDEEGLKRALASPAKEHPVATRLPASQRTREELTALIEGRLRDCRENKWR